jgi:Rrf2 family transcriptional regulator, iron-sulfur cluster assembly transcription factor
MKLTRSAGYALVAVGYIARNNDDQPILAKSIAKQYKIPLDYLLKILQQLVRAHILGSIRGPRGGFVLARETGRISLLHIIEAVDGPFITEPSLSPSKADANYNRKLVAVYEQASRQAAGILSKTTLSSLVPGRDRGGKKKSR